MKSVTYETEVDLDYRGHVPKMELAGVHKALVSILGEYPKTLNGVRLKVTIELLEETR